jgi:UDP-N-acetylmuramate dehydrogenase
MTIEHNYSLQEHNTFGIAALAAAFCEPANLDDIRAALRWHHSMEHKENERLLVLGGGSNMLFTSEHIEGFVMKIALRGVEVVRDDAHTVELDVAAGESWDAFVEYAVSQHWCGVENLSLIPGTVGAAPVQNIGAYGVELKDVVVSVQAIIRDTGEERTFTLAECAFGYRDSVFKRYLCDRCIITSVRMRLRKGVRGEHLNTGYGALREETARIYPAVPPEAYTVRQIREAVCTIRRSKLPDPRVIGNAGSFFKNPEVAFTVYQRIVSEYPAVPAFMLDSGLVKIPAGWLIEQCDWKGKRLEDSYGRLSDAGVHDKQALVLVNHGAAKGAEILALADAVCASVRERFGVNLETEVNVIR